LILFNFAFAFFGSDENSGIFSGSMLLQIGNSAIISVVLLMVAIPEGLPVAVSIAMALSVNNLKKDNILIKNLEAIQTCATLHDICVGKTGTLTTGDMRVAKFHFCDNVKSLFNSKPDSFNEEESIHP
jgi:P-type E1-E2 ATPase